MVDDQRTRDGAMRRGAAALGREEGLVAADALVLDANAVAGLLEEVFGRDLTAELAECAQCGHIGEAGTLLAFIGPGTVLRCSVCHEVVLRIVRTADATYVDARGAASLRLPLRPPS